jgi:putative redox protein
MDAMRKLGMNRTMGVTIRLKQEELSSHLTHGPSGSQLETTPPADNGGTGDRLSPTDLVAAALGACAVTTMALIAKREGLTLPSGARAEIVKEMTPPPRRIASLTVVIEMPPVKDAEKARLEQIARECPVARSLHPDVKIPMEFRYPQPLARG